MNWTEQKCVSIWQNSFITMKTIAWKLTKLIEWEHIGIENWDDKLCKITFKLTQKVAKATSLSYIAMQRPEINETNQSIQITLP